MENTIIYLIGHYGVGKLTVADAICAATGAKLFDNHLVNNVVFSLIRADGKTPMPDHVWDFIWNIRAEAVKAIEELAPREFSYILTNALDDEELDRKAYKQIVDLAARRGGIFVPVILTCSDEENIRRVTQPERVNRLKLTDPEAALHRRRTATPLPVVHPNRFDLDTTHLPSEEAAAQIISHVESLNK